jgi:hypothetical protein
MNGASILSIPLDEPERLFVSPAELRTEYIALLKHWHPDTCLEPVTVEEAAGITAHITALYSAAQTLIRSGVWRARRGGEMFLTGKDGKTRQIKFRVRRPFEIGEMLIGRQVITYMIPRTHEALVLAGLKAIGSIKYPSSFLSMRSQFPDVIGNFETADDYVIVVRKDINDVTVADLLAHLGGRIDPRHAAWIVSGLLNNLSFLGRVNGMAHNGLSPSTVWVNTIRHKVSFLGGFWYSAEIGRAITHLPPFSHTYAGRELLKTKKASPILDIECARAIGRFAMGDVSGGSFRLRDDIPAAITQFLRSPSRPNAVAEYESWYSALHDAYGVRQFHRWEVFGDDVYPEPKKD